eukprot:scaffold58147_cov60-Attheya_sp.AAC.3
MYYLYQYIGKLVVLTRMGVYRKGFPPGLALASAGFAHGATAKYTQYVNLLSTAFDSNLFRSIRALSENALPVIKSPVTVTLRKPNIANAAGEFKSIPYFIVH